MAYVSMNGIYSTSDQPLIFPDNRGFKYGDGFFETIRVKNGAIQLMKYHYDRILSTAATLKIEISKLQKQILIADILELCKINNCIQSSRVRISFYRNQNNEADYLMEAIPYLEKERFGEYKIDLCPTIKKPIDVLSNLKTSNYLPYIMASLDAQFKKVDDCLIANTNNAICDSSRASVFIIKDDVIKTPALSDGCINGTLRTYLIDNCSLYDFEIVETKVMFDEILNADEVFLTNAIMGIKSVTHCRNKTYGDKTVMKLYKKMIEPFDLLIVD